MKKLITLLLLLLFPGLALASFSDVSSRHENRDAIEYVQSAGIVKGYSDGTYQPNRTINRAEFTKIIIEAQYEPEDWNDCTSTRFADVKRTDWFAPYVCLAVEEGIIKGYSDNTFRPSQNISFVEAAKIIVVAMGYDVNADSTVWYRPYVRAMGDRAAIPTSVRDFSHSVTRGEMAEMIYRLKRSVRNKNSRSYDEMSGEGASTSSVNAEVGTGVFVNGTELSADVLASIAADHGGVQALPGKYWYDSTSGLYGNVAGRRLVKCSRVIIWERSAAMRRMEAPALSSMVAISPIAKSARSKRGWGRRSLVIIGWTPLETPDLWGIPFLLLICLPLHVLRAIQVTQEGITFGRREFTVPGTTTTATRGAM
ncbi:S-layer homology domain-containing protein [Candidatus Peregrinibacteria bacterium]|nr:MAG: S-layer homology domain-containing protein [Candidatus Peregrinibacteria bacterium]